MTATIEYQGFYGFKSSLNDEFNDVGRLTVSDLPALKKWLHLVATEFDGRPSFGKPGVDDICCLRAEPHQLYFQPGDNFKEFVIDHLNGYTSANESAKELKPEQIMQHIGNAHDDRYGFVNAGGIEVCRLCVVPWQQLWIAMEDFILNPSTPSKRMMWVRGETGVVQPAQVS